MDWQQQAECEEQRWYEEVGYDQVKQHKEVTKMALIAKNTGGVEFEKAPEGTHLARCYRVIDLGTQVSPVYGTAHRKILLSWELPHELVTFKDGDGNEQTKPFTVHNRYTLSLSEKAHLRKDLTSWRGKAFTEEELDGFDLKNILGAPCLLSVVHNHENGKTWVNIASVTKPTKGTECPSQVHPSVYFDLEERDMKVYESLSDGLKETIQKSQEWDQTKQPVPVAVAAGGEDFDDDIPFSSFERGMLV